MSTPKQLQKPVKTRILWGYAHNGGGLAVLHVTTEDDRLNALCKARGPFYPRAAGSVRVCHLCKFQAGGAPDIESR